MISFCYILHKKVIADRHNTFGYSCESAWLKKKEKNPNKTEICNWLFKSLPFIIQKTVYEISCLLKNSLLKLLCCTKTFFKRCENEITLFIRRIFPFLRWKVFHKSAFSVFFLKKTKKTPSHPDQKSVHKPLLISQSEKYCDFWASYPHAVFFRDHTSFWRSSPFTYKKTRKNMKMGSKTEVPVLC